MTLVLLPLYAQVALLEGEHGREDTAVVDYSDARWSSLWKS